MENYIGGGTNNIASTIGHNNVAIGQSHNSGSGYPTTKSGYYATISGGYSCSASGSSVIGSHSGWITISIFSIEENETVIKYSKAQENWELTSRIGETLIHRHADSVDIRTGCKTVRIDGFNFLKCSNCYLQESENKIEILSL